VSLAAVASSSRATAARLRPRRSLGGALSDSSGAVLQARPQRHRSLEEGGRASLSDGWQSRRSILRASQAAAAGWRRVYVVLGGGRLREYRNLQAARDDIVSRLVLTAQRGPSALTRLARWCVSGCGDSLGAARVRRARGACGATARGSRVVCLELDVAWTCHGRVSGRASRAASGASSWTCRGL